MVVSQPVATTTLNIVVKTIALFEALNEPIDLALQALETSVLIIKIARGAYRTSFCLPALLGQTSLQCPHFLHWKQVTQQPM